MGELSLPKGLSIAVPEATGRSRARNRKKVSQRLPVSYTRDHPTGVD